jgi:hypothetical protein
VIYDEIRPCEQEAEQARGDQAVAAERQDNVEKHPPIAEAIAQRRLDQRARQRGHECAQDEDGEGDPHGRVGQDKAIIGVEQAELRVNGIERVRHDDMRQHLRNEHQQDKECRPAHAEDDQRVGAGSRYGERQQRRRARHRTARDDMRPLRAGGRLVAVDQGRKGEPSRRRIEQRPLRLQGRVRHPVEREQHAADDEHTAADP